MNYFALLAIAALAIIAHPAVANAAVDPCKLVSFADASKAVGAPVTKTEPSTLPIASCTYKSSGFHQLIVTVEPFSSPAQANSEYHQTITNPATQDTPSMKLAGIGNDAQRLGAMIYVLKGSSIYVFSLLGLDANTSGALRVIALAKSVVPKL